MSPAHNDGYVAERGFTLIELMVAVTIFAIGMLALAALQGFGLKYNSDAYLRSQAVLFVSEMADRMRANIAGVNENDYAALAGPPNPLVSCVGATCTSAQMADADASEWYTSLALVLPNGTGSVTCVDSDTGDGDVCTNGSSHTIAVDWQGRFGWANYTVRVVP